MWLRLPSAVCPSEFEKSARLSPLWFSSGSPRLSAVSQCLASKPMVADVWKEVGGLRSIGKDLFPSNRLVDVPIKQNSVLTPRHRHLFVPFEGGSNCLIRFSSDWSYNTKGSKEEDWLSGMLAQMVPATREAWRGRLSRSNRQRQASKWLSRSPHLFRRERRFFPRSGVPCLRGPRGSRLRPPSFRAHRVH